MPSYRIDDFVRDVSSGHRVVASVFVETRAMYRSSGPEAMRVVGETEFDRGLSAMSVSGEFGPPGLFAGIVGRCDLAEPAYKAVLAAHVEAGGGRFKGVRLNAQYSGDKQTGFRGSTPPEHLMLDEPTKSGVATLAAWAWYVISCAFIHSCRKQRSLLMQHPTQR